MKTTLMIFLFISTLSMASEGKPKTKNKKQQKAKIEAVMTQESTPATSEATLIVNITNIKRVDPLEGQEKVDQLLVNLFNQEEGFPGKNPLANRVVKTTGETMQIVFKDLKPGEHAVSVIHDENGNGKVDLKKALFIPVGIAEGYGASNDAKGSMGPPKFSDAKFSVNGPKTEISIKLEY